MRSVILITSNENIFNDFYWQWEKMSPVIFKDISRMSIVIYGESIYIDKLDREEAGYEDNELAEIKIEKPQFYAICYSNKEVMQYFLKNSTFNNDSFFDNDEGNIVPLSKFNNMDILSFIQ